MKRNICAFLVISFLAQFSLAKEVSIFQNLAELIDQSSQVFNLEKFNNKVLLVVVGYTSCPSLCPMITGQLKKLEKSLSDQNVLPSKVQILFLSIDPEDKPESLLKYSQKHKLDLQRWTLAQVKPTDKDKLIKKLGLSYDKTKSKNHLRHSFSLVVIDPAGTIAKTYPSALSLDLDQVTQQIKSLSAKSL